MIRIKYNTEGELLEDAFYYLDIPQSIGIYEDVPDESSGTIVAGTIGVDYFYAEIIKRYEAARRCAAKQAHVLEWRTTEVFADLFGWLANGRTEMGVLLPDSSMFYIAMKADFATQFTQQKFRGAKVKPLKVNVNQSDLPNPRFSYVDVEAPHCMREAEVIINGSIACPYCGWKPMVCPACNYWERYCPNCQKDPYVDSDKHEGGLDVRFKRDRGVAIWEGRRWKGTDFMGSGPYAVSERVVQWLLATHAYPFIAKPLHFDITGMTAEQIRMLKEVAPKAAREL